jgi:hypothetical protein
MGVLVDYSVSAERSVRAQLGALARSRSVIASRAGSRPRWIEEEFSLGLSIRPHLVCGVFPKSLSFVSWQD